MTAFLLPAKQKNPRCLSFSSGHGHIILQMKKRGGFIMFVMTMTKRKLIRAVMFVKR